MKKMMLAIALFFAPAFASGQNTDCNINDQSMHCTTTPTTLPDPFEAINKARAAKAQAAAAAAAAVNAGAQAQETTRKQQLAESENKATVDFIYCRQSPKGSITNGGGQQTCADVIEYTKAFCLVNPDVERCTLAKSKTEVEKAFASLLIDQRTDPRRNKKDNQMFFDSLFAKLTRWGCMSFPDMTLPQRDGTLHLCPDAPDETASQSK